MKSGKTAKPILQLLSCELSLILLVRWWRLPLNQSFFRCNSRQFQLVDYNRITSQKLTLSRKTFTCHSTWGLVFSFCSVNCCPVEISMLIRVKCLFLDGMLQGIIGLQISQTICCFSDSKILIDRYCHLSLANRQLQRRAEKRILEMSIICTSTHLQLCCDAVLVRTVQGWGVVQSAWCRIISSTTVTGSFQSHRH